MEWRACPNFPGYEASDAGDARRNGKLLTKQFQDGYVVYGLSFNGKAARVKACRLVIDAFGEPRPTKKHMILHGNGVHSDDRASNLSWGTAKDNAADARRHGTLARWERHGCAKITFAEVDKIRDMARDGMAQRRIAREFGLAQSHVWRIVHEVSWAA